MLSFEDLRTANVTRCEGVFHLVDEWSPTDWACALAGELGEVGAELAALMQVCNSVKKLRRWDDDSQRGMVFGSKADLVADIAKELADTVLYCDLLGARLGINLGEAVRGKFNEVSAKRGSTVRL